MRLRILPALFLIACGSSPAPSSSTAPAPATESSAAAPPVDDERCLASMARTRPTAGWSEVGKLVVPVEDGRPTSFEARDADGKVVEKKPAPSDRRSAQELMATLTCRLGGLVAALDGKEPPKQGVATFTVLKPNAPDEKTDVAMLCKEPADMPHDGLDEKQKVRIAVDMYQERLTSKKWRAWLKDAGARAPAAADELAAAANSPCWFADGLRKY